MIRVLWLLTFLVNHDLTVFTTNYETLRVCNDALDEEVLTRALSQQHFIVTVAFQQHDLALISAYNKAAVGHPSVTGKIV